MQRTGIEPVTAADIVHDVTLGGFQEPAHGAANSLHGLFTRPDQAARLRADPAAWSAARPWRRA